MIITLLGIKLTLFFSTFLKNKKLNVNNFISKITHLYNIFYLNNCTVNLTYSYNHYLPKFNSLVTTQNCAIFHNFFTKTLSNTLHKKNKYQHIICQVNTGIHLSNKLLYLQFITLLLKIIFV